MFIFNPYYDPSPLSWVVVDNSMSYFCDFCHRQKIFIPGAVRSLLPELTYPWWYTSLPLVHFVFGSVNRV